MLGMQHLYHSTSSRLGLEDISGIVSSISEADIFIYSCSAQLISFEIKSISKEVNCAEHKFMNMSPSLIELAMPLEDILISPKMIMNERVEINLFQSFKVHIIPIAIISVSLRYHFNMTSTPVIYGLI